MEFSTERLETPAELREGARRIGPMGPQGGSALLRGFYQNSLGTPAVSRSNGLGDNACKSIQLTAGVGFLVIPARTSSSP